MHLLATHFRLLHHWALVCIVNKFNKQCKSKQKKENCGKAKTFKQEGAYERKKAIKIKPKKILIQKKVKNTEKGRKETKAQR